MTERPIRVLAIDGGGIRGLVPARVLAALEARTGHRTGDLFDCIAGTSTGGVIAVGVSVRAPDGSPAYSADDAVALYRDRGQDIFPPLDVRGTAKEIFTRDRQAAWRSAREVLVESSQRLTSALGVNPGSEGNARYEAGGLERVLEEYLGTTMLSETRPDVVVPSYDIRHRELVVFTTRGARADPALDIPLRIAARATTAAPTYLPPIEHRFGGVSRILIDGGVVMNNPSALALAEVAASGMARGREVVILSIGTGRPLPPDPSTIHYEGVSGENWLGLARDILSVSLQGSSDGLDRIMRDIGAGGLGIRYERLQIDLPESEMGLDRTHPSNIAALLASADRLVEAEAPLLDELAAILAPPD